MLLSYCFGSGVRANQSSKLRLTDTLVLEELNKHLLRSAWPKSFWQQVVRCWGAGILATNNLEAEILLALLTVPACQSNIQFALLGLRDS